MQNLSLKTLLSAALITLLIMIILLGTMSIRSELESVKKLDELNTISALQANDANRLKTHLMEVRLRLARMLLHDMSGNAERATQALEQARDNLAAADQLVANLIAVDMAPQSQRRTMTDAIATAYQEVMTPALRQSMAEGDYQALDAQRDILNQSFITFSEAVDQFSTYALARGQELIEGEREDSHMAMLLVGGLLALGLLLYIAVHLLVSRGVVAPLKQAGQLCEAIAKGDLTRTIEARGNNEIGKLYVALGNMQMHLEKIIDTLSQSGEAVAASSKQIASGSQDLASRTEQQAAALQQTAASMDEISSLVRQNAETAAEAERLTQEAAGKVARGQETSARTTELMNELEATSHRVHDIVQVIDTIAFQTNILALNASVEAARAGEHGRGFAVVASEVRSLATKTSTSSKEIRSMIEDIAGRIAEGAKQTSRSRQEMEAINAAIYQVNDMMQALALAAKEQDSGVSQVSTAVAQMDSATQENVSLVEETSTASASLEGEAERLANLVKTFTLKTSGTGLRHNVSRATSLPAPQRTASEPEWEAF